MPYTLSQAANIQAITEREWGVGPLIRFTTFTSCIGVVAKVTGQNQVIGIHLGIRDAEDNCFSADDVTLVTGVLNTQQFDPSTVKIFGTTDAWADPEQVGQPVANAYEALLNALNITGDNTIALPSDSEYGAKIENGNIDIFI